MHSLSVIIPVYNTAEYLPACLDSLLVQNIFEGEIICIDDGSTDTSPQILQTYAEHYPCIRIITQTNQRQGAARNAGIKAAKHDYILMVDSDDMVVAGAIERVLNKITDEDVLYFTTCEYSQSKGTISDFPHRAEAFRINGREYFEKIVDLNDYSNISPVAFYRRQFLQENSILFIPGVYHEDHAWIAHLLCHAGSVSSLDEPLYVYRLREGSTMHSISIAHCRDRMTVAANIINYCQSHHWFPHKMRQFVWHFDYWDAIEHGVAHEFHRKDYFHIADWWRMYRCCTSRRERRITVMALSSLNAAVQYKNYQTPHILRKIFNAIVH